MAKQFNLTIQLALKGPGNLNAVVGNINKQLQNISADVNIKISKNLQTNVTNLNKGFQALNSTLSITKTRASDAADALNLIAKAIGQINQNSNLNNTNSQITKTTKNLQAATSQAEGFGKAAGLAFKRFAAFSTITAGIFGLTAAIGSGVKEAIQFEKELIKVSQVTGTSVSGLKDLTDEISRLAVKFGVSSKELLNVSSTLAQAGLSAKDTKIALEALAKSDLAPSFKNLGETTEGVIAIMAQFGLKAKDLEKVLSSINTVSNKFAVESEDIISAVRITGGAFAATSKGVSEGTKALNEFIAVFTSVRATTRESAESIATGLRTIFTRLERSKTVEALKEFGVELSDLEGKFVGPYEAVNRLSDALNKLDPRDFRFSGIVEELGGYRQIGKVIPLIQQAELRFKALKAAEEGVGSLAEDAAVAQQSLGNRIAVVTEQFLALIRAVSQTDSFKAIVTLALDGASAFIRLADAIKPLIPYIGILATAKFASAVVPFAKGFAGAIKGKHEGGSIQKFARGGFVPGSGNTDSVHAMLQPGEFVLRKKAVQALGPQKVSSLNKYANGGPIAHFTDGTEVDNEINFIRNASPAEKIARYKSVKKADARLARIDPSVKAANQAAAAERAAKKNTKAEQKKAAGLLDIFTQGPPIFGALAFKRGDSKDSLVSSNVKSLTGKDPTKLQDMAKRLDVDPKVLGNFKSNLSLHLIDDSVAKDFGATVKRKFIGILDDLVTEYGGTFTTGSGKAGVLKKVEERLSLDSVCGYAFEGLVSALSGQALPKDKHANFDFPTNKVHGVAFKKLFGNIPSSVKYLDAKSTLSRHNLSNGSGSVLGKAFRESSKDFSIPITTLDSDPTLDLANRPIQQGTGVTSRLALTPKVNKLPFAKGGFVQKFLTGGEVVQSPAQVRNLADTFAKLHGAPSSFVKSIQPLSQELIDNYKKVNGVNGNVEALYRPSEKSIHYVPGQTTSRQIIHELGHALDQHIAEQLGHNDKFSSQIPGTRANQLANNFRQTRLGQLSVLNNKRISKYGQKGALSQAFIANRLAPHELFADGLANSIFKDKKALGRLAFAKGGPNGTDTVPAMLTPGEFVVNKKAASAIGLSTLHKLNHADKYAKGGPVGFANGGKAVNVGGQTFNLRNFPAFDAAVQKSTKGASDGAKALVYLKDDLLKTGASIRAVETGLNSFIKALERNQSISSAELKAHIDTIKIQKVINKNNAINAKPLARLANSSPGKAINRGFKAIGGAPGLATAGFFAGPLLQNAIGTKTVGAAGTGGAIGGALAGGSAGAIAGPYGAALGAVIGALTGFNDAVIEKGHELANLKLTATLEKTDEAFSKFNKDGNLKTLDESLQKTLPAILDDKNNKNNGFFGSKAGRAGSIAAQVTDERGLTGRISDLVNLADKEQRQAEVQARVDEFAKKRGGDLAELYRPAKENAESIVTNRIKAGDSIQKIIANKGLTSAIGRTRGNLPDIVKLEDANKQLSGQAQDLRATGDPAKIKQAAQLEATAAAARLKIQDLEQAATAAFIRETQQQIDLTNKLIQAFANSDNALASFTKNLDRLDNSLDKAAENRGVREGRFGQAVTSAKAGGAFSFSNTTPKAFGAFSNDKVATERKFAKIDNVLGGGLKGLSDLETSLKGLNEFKANFRDSVLAKTTQTNNSDQSVEEKVLGALDTKSFAALPKVFKEEIKNGLGAAFAKRQEGQANDLTESLAVQQVDAIVSQFSKNLDRLNPILQKLEAEFDGLQHSLRDGLNAAVEIQVDQNNKVKKVNQLRLSQENDFNTLLGRTLTIDQKSAPAEVGLGGRAAGDILKEAQAQKATLENTKSQTFAPVDDAGRQQLEANKNLAVALQENIAALETLATDTTRLSAIQEKFSQVQAKKDDIKNNIQNLLGSNLADLTKQRGVLRNINSGQKLDPQQFQEALAFIKQAPGRTDEERQKAATNFTKRQLGSEFDLLPKSAQDALTNVGGSPEEKELIVQFKAAQKAMLDANVALAEFTKGEPQKIFSLAVDNFNAGVKDLTVTLKEELFKKDPANPQVPAGTPPKEIPVPFTDPRKKSSKVADPGFKFTPAETQVPGISPKVIPPVQGGAGQTFPGNPNAGNPTYKKVQPLPGSAGQTAPGNPSAGNPIYKPLPGSAGQTLPGNPSVGNPTYKHPIAPQFRGEALERGAFGGSTPLTPAQKAAQENGAPIEKGAFGPSSQAENGSISLIHLPIEQARGRGTIAARTAAAKAAFSTQHAADRTSARNTIASRQEYRQATGASINYDSGLRHGVNTNIDLSRKFAEGNGLSGADARQAFASSHQNSLDRVSEGQRKAAAQNVTNAATAASVRSRGGEGFQEKYKAALKANPALGIPTVSAALPVNQQYEDMLAGRKKSYEADKASRKEQFLQANPVYRTKTNNNFGGALAGAGAAAGGAAAAAAAGGAAAGGAAAGEAAKVAVPNFEGFMKGAQSLENSAQLLSKIPTKIEVGVTIAPVEVIINGAQVFANLEPGLQKMIAGAIGGQMNKQFNIDGSQKEVIA